MAHKRNDAESVRRRRENALSRWMQNRLMKYTTQEGVRSDKDYVDKQISILEKRITVEF